MPPSNLERLGARDLETTRGLLRALGRVPKPRPLLVQVSRGVWLRGDKVPAYYRLGGSMLPK